MFCMAAAVSRANLRHRWFVPSCTNCCSTAAAASTRSSSHSHLFSNLRAACSKSDLRNCKIAYHRSTGARTHNHHFAIDECAVSSLCKASIDKSCAGRVGKPFQTRFDSVTCRIFQRKRSKHVTTASATTTAAATLTGRGGCN